jgi:hypothetical protein
MKVDNLGVEPTKVQ